MSDIPANSPTHASAARDWLLIGLTFAAGAVDAISYFGLGRIFSAFMTGNLVFLGLRIADTAGPALLPVACAVIFFAVGALLGTWIARTSSPAPGLWPGRVSACLAAVAILEAVFLGIWLAHAGQPSEAAVTILLGVASLAMGLQTAAVRALGVLGVFTTAATFTLLAFAGDFAGTRPKADAPRLAGVLLALVAGAAAGGAVLIRAAPYAPALPLAATLVVLVAGLFLGRRRDPSAAVAKRG
jgi:uncharacterized membrane protein YoaK (UPF0700 family)